jgi:hypothetical protein
MIVEGSLGDRLFSAYQRSLGGPVVEFWIGA